MHGDVCVRPAAGNSSLGESNDQQGQASSLLVAEKQNDDVANIVSFLSQF